MADGPQKPYEGPGLWRQRMRSDWYRDLAQGFTDKSFNQYALEKLQGMANAGQALTEQQEKARKRLAKITKRRAER